MSDVKPVALIWLLVLVSALSVAFVSHLCRQKYAQLTELEREASQLQVDYGKYLLEHSAWGSLQRIETMATVRLNMRSPQAQEILIIKRQ